MTSRRARTPHPARSRLPVPARLEPEAGDTAGRVPGYRTLDRGSQDRGTLDRGSLDRGSLGSGAPDSGERTSRGSREQALWALRGEQRLLQGLLDGGF